MKARTGRKFTDVLKVFVIIAIVVLALAIFFTGISNLQGGAGDEGRRQLEDSIRRTAAACYVAEGIYPPSLEYMEENYGLQVDKEHYYVDYIVFADNLMPDFTVIELDEDHNSAGPVGP